MALGERNIVIDAGLFVIGVVAGLLSFYIVLFRVTRPLGRMTKSMTRLATGDVEIDFPWASRRDEIGEMGRALQVFRENIIEKAKLQREQEEKDANARGEKRRAMLGLADRFEGEVKNLSNQTARATEDISQQIASIQNETTSAVADIRDIRDVIGEINDISMTIAAAVEQQGASTREIARNVQQAAKGTGEVDAKIAVVSKATGETGAAAGQVVSATGALAEKTDELSREVEAFLSAIRAG